jgi:hypothetical protein
VNGVATPTANSIEVRMDPFVPSGDWQRQALRLAREAVSARGIAWVDADILVMLPGRDRCYTKAPGHTELIAHG